ncbi:glucosidase [Nitrospira sp. KM1]|uniref:MGH1-like glycoside hydrolase domain-containing protein n=1 Tax=Nitrospira sp. KM1 TaxID=1936990 RepID=UPI0013A75C90|nr:glucosidase [Nitrospira sp. KM1]BCA53052.1 glucosidase [Nitrospira sp. KM1]
MTEEHERLEAARTQNVAWRRWGPYLSERQWGTVREDYSHDGNAWDFFSHDQARSRAYHWGEDGLAGFSDDKQRLCFALALWNSKDPILKERLFGLTNSEGNHGEDVKEYYFYLDSTPTHSYMKYLYKYPQPAYPYDDLVKTNKSRTRHEMEYELLDTGVFDEDKYFDVFVEYAKESPEDILIKVTVHNRGKDTASLHVLPTLWFRNTWSWSEGVDKPSLEQSSEPNGMSVIAASHPELGNRYLWCEGEVPLLFTENETNMERIFNQPNRSSYVKDGINQCIVHGQDGSVNPLRTGTKASAHYQMKIPGGGSKVIRMRLCTASPSDTVGSTKGEPFGKRFDTVVNDRLREADEFYGAIAPPSLSADEKHVMRQAMAGMLWSKQYYYFDLDLWLREHGVSSSEATKALHIRNRQWLHMVNDDVISMPDKWEYPWYAAWDLAFHTVALATVDPDFAKNQLDLMLREVYLHPNGQIPAYEWNFGDVNPPVHAWATNYVYSLEKSRRGQGDIKFLEHAFQKLLLNFTWWVNRKDPSGRNVFEGGFLGLDNIGVFDRSSPLPTGGTLEQADGTAWMALFSQNMLQIALELASNDPVYEGMTTKFLEHFFRIAGSMDRVGEHQDEMWDEEDGFFYDILRLPDGNATRLKVRSMVGLLPLCATTIIPEEFIHKFPKTVEQARRFLKRDPDLFANVASPTKAGVAGRRLFAVMNENKLRRVLARMLDEERFLSPYGIRSLSRHHLDDPYILHVHGEEFRVQYLPAESNNGMFGGNSNWRGPIWMPVNVLIIRALMHFYLYYGNDFKVECPTGSGKMMNLFEVARDISGRLTAIFRRDAKGKRPVYGGSKKFQDDPHWRDHILFYEYFHGDNGAGLGASHQTGWTGLVGGLISLFGRVNEKEWLEKGIFFGPIQTPIAEDKAVQDPVKGEASAKPERVEK